MSVAGVHQRDVAVVSVCATPTIQIPAARFMDKRAGSSIGNADGTQLRDTQAGTRGAVPHFSQLYWHFSGETSDHFRSVVVEGNSYVVGRGDPGTDINGACGNNCIIDSLRQCIGIVADCRQVRRDLINEFAGATGDRARAGVANYLDVEAQWRSILRSLFRHKETGLPVTWSVDDFRVIALSANNAGHGSVEGHLDAPRTLVVLNDNDVHFDHCLPVAS